VERGSETIRQESESGCKEEFGRRLVLITTTGGFYFEACGSGGWAIRDC
jgi:hypothetical protein